MTALVRTSLTNSQVSAGPAWAGEALGRYAARFRTWRQRARERRALAALTPRELADFGASTADVYRELSTPFWRALPPC